jgi:hypothetical protein
LNSASSESVKKVLESGRSWEGRLTCKRLTGDTVRLDTKVVPVVQFATTATATAEEKEKNGSG